MKHELLTSAANLTNADLLARLQHLAARGRENTAEMIAHLAELEARRTFLGEGYGSLFDYCQVALRLSEHETYNRVAAANVVRRFPAILDRLVDGSLNLTTVRLLAPHLTPENHHEVLARACGLPKREVERLVACLAPQPDALPLVRRLQVDRTAADDVPAPILGSTLDPKATAPSVGQDMPVAMKSSVGVPGPGIARPKAAVVALSPARYRVQCTIGEEGHANLRLAQDLLRREIPSGDPGAIVEQALSLLVSHVAREKTAATTAPRTARPGVPGSPYIPAAVKRAVWLRDRGQCAFVARSGRRCGEHVFLELHHIQPFAMGGEATVDNISLRCRPHNVYEAELAFGRYEPRPEGMRERPEHAKGPADVRAASPI